MKHYLLLTLFFLSVACKNINSTSTDTKVRNLPFDNSVYLSIPHHEDQSILRRKLLNLSLTNQFKISDKVEENFKVKDGDEFNFTNDSFKPSSLNLEEYKKFKANAAEVIVSYKDRLEIYFVPTGIERGKALDQLGVTTEPEATLSWVISPDNILLKNKVYYLLSATRFNLLENDIYFNQQKISLGNDFNEKVLSFSSNQILELEVSVDYSLRETSFVTLGGQNVKCTRDMQEAGACDPCHYKLEAPTNHFIKIPLESSELVNLDIIINGRNYPFNELNPKKDLNGIFRVTLDLKKLVKTDMTSVQIFQNTQYPVLKTVQAVEMASTCAIKNVSSTIDITPVVKMNLELNVKGRILNI
jgi:hypothetical protein